MEEQQSGSTNSTEVFFEASGPRRASLLVKIVVGVLLIIGVGWVLSALREKPADIPREVVQGTGATSTFASFAPILADGKKYTLGGVQWMFEPEQNGADDEQTTRVRLRLVDLRRNGVPIDVAQYRLGTYRGTCEPLDIDAYRTLVGVPDNALAFAQCTFDGTSRQLGVFQEGDAVVVKVRSVTEDSIAAEQMISILTVHTPQIVQVGQ